MAALYMINNLANPDSQSDPIGTLSVTGNISRRIAINTFGIKYLAIRTYPFDGLGPFLANETSKSIEIENKFPSRKIMTNENSIIMD